MNISEKQKQEIKSLIDKISNNLYGIADYCNLKEPKMIDYDAKQYPINIIEKWAEEGKKQIDKLEEIFKT